MNIETLGGGVQFDLLWTNPAPSAAFSPQLVTVDNISQYTLVMILFKNAMSVAPVSDSTTMFEASGGTNATAGAYQSRAFQIKSNGIQFFGGAQGGVSANNGYMIPRYIYGIKL